MKISEEYTDNDGIDINTMFSHTGLWFHSPFEDRLRGKLDNLPTSK